MPNPIADPLVENAVTSDFSKVVSLETTREGVAVVTINRAGKRNALDPLTIEGLSEAFETLHASEHVRVIFLRGEGANFSAGADLEWMSEASSMTEDGNREDAEIVAHMLKALWEIPAPTVALVQGAAMGGGAGLVAACDMAIAVTGSRFCFSEVRLGLIPAMISPYVVQAIGPRAAAARFMTGRVFDADEALRIGLVDEVVADAAALEAAQKRIADDLMAGAPGAVVDAKQLVRDVHRHGRIDEGLIDDTARRLASRRVSDEGREGVSAFLAKRKPNWAG